MPLSAVFPSEFSDLLSPRGRRVLAGRDAALCGALARPACRFVAVNGLIDRKRAAACLQLLDKRMLPVMSEMADIIPPESLWGMTQNYAEQLPKTMRVQTAYLQRRRTRAYAQAEELGLLPMLRSESFAALAAVVAGRALKRKSGAQVLCYGPGDYAGPHNDHHPQEADAAKGYLDVHISLATPAVAHHWLVYASQGHLQNIANVNTLGGMTFYRLPFWHYTTPLAAKRRQEAAARRWLLLGTFLFKTPLY